MPPYEVGRLIGEAMTTRTAPVPAGELRLHGVYRRYVAQQRLARKPIELSDWQIADLARLARTTLQPRTRDVEVVRGPTVDDEETPELTAPVLRVLEFLPTELDLAEMARLQGVTVHQVKRSVRVLYAELGVESRHGAVAVAIGRGLLRLEGGAWRAVRPPERLLGAGATDRASDGSAGPTGAILGFGGEQ